MVQQGLIPDGVRKEISGARGCGLDTDGATWVVRFGQAADTRSAIRDKPSACKYKSTRQALASTRLRYSLKNILGQKSSPCDIKYFLAARSALPKRAQRSGAAERIKNPLLSGEK